MIVLAVCALALASCDHKVIKSEVVENDSTVVVADSLVVDTLVCDTVAE